MKLLRLIGLLCLVVIAGAIYSYSTGDRQTRSNITVAEAATPPPRVHVSDEALQAAKNRLNATSEIPAHAVRHAKAMLKLSITKSEWTLGGFGAVPLFDVTIKNANDFPVSDIVLECMFVAESGTPLNTKRETIYQRFPAGKSKRVKEVNLGFVNPQVAGASCNIVDFAG